MYCNANACYVIIYTHTHTLRKNPINPNKNYYVLFSRHLQTYFQCISINNKLAGIFITKLVS